MHAKAKSVLWLGENKSLTVKEKIQLRDFCACFLKKDLIKFCTDSVIDLNPKHTSDIRSMHNMYLTDMDIYCRLI